jgi:hypothetical protein
MSSAPRSRGPRRRRLSLAHEANCSPRLALSHNLLTTLPSRIVECKRLRYLNVRYNAMREIPDCVRCPPPPMPPY